MKKQGARILVADGELEIRCLLQRIFVAHEYRVFTTASVGDTLEALAQYRPDLLLLGLDGSGRSGLEICQQVRAQSRLPIIVLSANKSECTKVRTLDLGVDDYVCKPFGVRNCWPAYVSCSDTSLGHHPGQGHWSLPDPSLSILRADWCWFGGRRCGSHRRNMTS
ncbi:MAG TPA: response regulator [Ktedonosporobacter sp.]|nr:response regulator [Ktedonosporobacter sp.]